VKAYEKWFVKEQTKEIDGVETPLPVFNIEYLPYFVMMDDKKAAPIAIANLLRLGLKKSFPGITDEAIGKIPVTTLLNYFMATMEANGLDIPDDSAELIAKAQGKIQKG